MMYDIYHSSEGGGKGDGGKRTRSSLGIYLV
jgi:hypothetical protein